jgi:predicted metalloprotease with PDZ domain
VAESYLTDPGAWAMEASLLPHEYTHSWNGKYRRPAGLATPDYEKPMDGNLLWVYEGLTEYFGYVLTARSGLQTPEQWRDNYALVAMMYSHRPGRKWRSLEDTAIAAQTLYAAPEAFSNYRRSVDYYDEGALIWLEADTIIRQKSNGAKSMDDFAHLFLGGENTPPMVKTYTFEDVVNTLNQVQPFDWRGFLTERILKVAPEAPLAGLANSGWKVEYNEQPNSIQKIHEEESGGLDLTASVGLVLGKEGMVADSIEDGVAFRSGVVPGMKLVAVNGRKYSHELLLEAIHHARETHEAIQLIVENDEFFHTVSLAYFEGLRYPHLVRDESKPDLLGAITAPKVTKLPAPFTAE